MRSETHKATLIHLSKEPNMEANTSNIYDAGLATDLPKLDQAGKSTTPKTKASAKAGSAKWLITGLLILSAIPLIAGAFRVTELTGGAEVTQANARFFASPLPVVIHVLGAAVYAILGAFQFSTRFRRSSPGWHRTAGRLLVPCGLLVGLSGVWMTLFYPGADGLGGLLLYAFRLLAGLGMMASIVLGLTTILRGDVRRHRAWMMRAYALGLGAGTQVLTQAAGEIIAGKPDDLGKALLMGAGWAINLAVAEWAIRRQRRPVRNLSSGPTNVQTRLAPPI
jgi:hypothetical protein